MNKNLVRNLLVGATILGGISSIYSFNLSAKAPEPTKEAYKVDATMSVAGISLYLDNCDASVLANSINLVGASNVEETTSEEVTSKEVASEEIILEPVTQEAIEPVIIEEPTKEVTESSRQYNYYTVNDNGIYETLNTEYQDYLWSTCVEYGISDYYELLMAQMFTESGFDSSCVSDSNDWGLMQINSCNHDWLSKTLGVSDFLNPYESIKCGCFIMSSYLNKYDTSTALVAYNMGEGAVKRGIYSSSYSDRVLNNLEKLEIIN